MLTRRFLARHSRCDEAFLCLWRGTGTACAMFDAALMWHVLCMMQHHGPWRGRGIRKYGIDVDISIEAIKITLERTYQVFRSAWSSLSTAWFGHDIVVMIKHVGGSIGLSKVASRLNWDRTVRRDFTLRLKTNIRSMIGGNTRQKKITTWRCKRQ